VHKTIFGPVSHRSITPTVAFEWQDNDFLLMFYCNLRSICNRYWCPSKRARRERTSPGVCRVTRRG